MFPENHQALLEQFAPRSNRKAVFCQNQYQVFRGLGGRADYAAYGVRHVVCPGYQVATFCRRRLPSQDIYIVPNPIDRTLFQPSSPKSMQIAFAPSKRPLEAAFIQDLFRAENPEFRNIPWFALAKLSERDVARQLSRVGPCTSL